ncbi:hypothetical protein [Bdellovibrio sp. HCB337]|uniref:hypothetical protein n=1 Tax=Bdellovibrio sp. HCB337 TaxID=3394358 RepID=UPI0039A44D10
MKKILMTLTLVFLSACANDSNETTDHAMVPQPTPTQPQGYPQQPQPYPQPYPQPAPQPQYPYYYNLPGNNCNTGMQRYQTRAQYCAGLRNDYLNNHCALPTRYQYFREYCHGSRWQR